MPAQKNSPKSKSSLKSAAKSPAKSASKGAAKPVKAAAKGSKLASIKKLIFGEAKKAPPAKVAKKAVTPAKAATGKSAGKAPAGAKPSAKAAEIQAAGPMKKGAKGSAPLPPAKAAGKAGKSKGISLRAAGIQDSDTVCREVACEGLATSAGYCRMHYIKNWKKIKRKELILKEGKLNRYIEELVAKYPDKYIEAIRQDLASDKDFSKVIYDLDLDEGADDFDVEGESIDSVIDTIKRDFDDEGEGGF